MKALAIAAILFLIAMMILTALTGCVEQKTHIVSITDQPLIELGGWIPPFDIVGFKGYDWRFKWDNMMAQQINRPDLIWYPWNGPKPY